MDTAAGVADLHAHTTASDGTSTVAERVAQAAERGLDAVALTDHDCIADALTDRQVRRDGVEVVSGVEVRGDVDGTKVEILGYFVDPEDDGLQSVLERARSYRRDRNRAMVERLADAADLDVTYADLAASVDGNVGRPHMADVLLEAGVVDSVGEAFGQYLGSDGAAYVPMERVPAAEVVDAIQGAGGVASLAHPGRIRTDDVPALLDELVEAGLDAIEVWYPYEDAPSDDAYADVDVADAAALADERDLLRTGGSDCHGPDSGKFRIGAVRVPQPTLEELRRLAARRRPL